MAALVLVHGAWQGAWCWREVVARLEHRGHRAVAIDLPAHGEDGTPAESVGFEDYVDAVVRAVESCRGRPVLVGHSMGATVCAAAAEAVPDAIRALVAVAAPAAVDGAAMMDAVGAADPEYLGHVVWAPDRLTAQLARQGIRDFLCPLAAPEVMEWAAARFVAEPVAPFTTPVRITAERYGRVPRYYIGCAEDRVVTPEMQRRASAGLPASRVYGLASDHSPFFTAPAELANCLDKIANES